MRFIATTTIVLTVSLLPAAEPLKYPMTRRIDHVDELHGVRVPDPYRWLEDDVRKSKDVADWVDAENKVTFAYLESIPERARIKKRLTELWNYEKLGLPYKVAGRYFFTRNDGLQNQSVVCVVDRLGDEPKVILDPNKWTKDGTTALAEMAYSPDGNYLAYSISEAGSDWETIKVLDLRTFQPLADEVKWVKESVSAWTKDGKGFFYSRFDAPKEGQEFQDVNRDHKVFYHRVGTPQADDVLVYKRPDQPDWAFVTTVTEDGRYLILTVAKGTDDKYRIIYRDLAEPFAMPVELIDSFDNNYTFVGNEGPVFYFRTDLNAPRGRLIAIDLRKPARESWKEIIPQAKENLTDVALVGNLFIAEYLKDAHSQVKVHRLDGALVRELEFPVLGTAAGFRGKQTDTETFYSFSSFATPPSIFRYDLLTGKSTLFHRAKVEINSDDYVVKQIFYEGKDGTKIPMFISHKKGINLDGANPTLLYGYGGFNIPVKPEFSISRLAWMEMGGVYAQPCLRGGGEYGEEWHKAGTKLRKQNVFDDFIAAAEYLIREKYTTSKKLAIQGRSNGGLLVGACLTQRPDLFGACLPAVGVMDMLRFHKFTAGRYWVDDYGCADNADEFKALYAYSPYHNIKKGVKYPPTLVTTADTDDRVVPGHSFKFIAMLQHCQAGDAPVLARIDTRAGHGAGKPTAKKIEEVADEWAFLVKYLGMKSP